MNRLFRFLLLLWTLGYLLVSCGPLLLSSSAAAKGGGILVGSILLVPWLVGVLVLAIFVWLTNPRGRA